MQVLEALAAHAGPVPTMALARECGIPKSSTYHLLNVLRARGFVAYDPQARAWTLGPRVRELAPEPPTLAQAIAALTAFDRASPSLSAEEVAVRSGLRASTAARVLAELEEVELVTAADGRYSLGIRLAALAARIEPLDRLRAAARPVLFDLRDDTAETANLVVREGDQLVYLEQVESPHALRHAGWTGRTIPLEGSAAGAALHAGPDAVEVRLDTVEPGVGAIARRLPPPVELPAVVSVTGPSVRLTPERVPAIVAAVRAAGDRIAAAYAAPDRRPRDQARLSAETASPRSRLRRAAS